MGFNQAVSPRIWGQGGLKINIRDNNSEAVPIRVKVMLLKCWHICKNRESQATTRYAGVKKVKVIVRRRLRDPQVHL